MINKALSQISYGMYIVSSAREGVFNGQIANAICQITNDPVTVAVSINKNNLTHEFIEKSGYFTLSILEKKTPLKIIGKFGFKSGRDIQKFNETEYKVLDSGCPVVTQNVLSYFEAKVVKSMDCGTYTLFLGEVISSSSLKEGAPMTYAYYHEEKCGSTPASAPTYSADEEKIECSSDPKYRCTVCNYIYNPALGDPDGGIAPGTPFEEIPDDWICPICGVDKKQFVKEE